MSIDTDFGPATSHITGAAADKRRHHRVTVALNDEQMAAVEGWRHAHGIADQSEALGELVRLALLGEIAKIYRLVSENRKSSRRGRPANEDGTAG
jgi:hypothetical protein